MVSQYEYAVLQRGRGELEWLIYKRFKASLICVVNSRTIFDGGSPVVDRKYHHQVGSFDELRCLL